MCVCASILASATSVAGDGDEGAETDQDSGDETVGGSFGDGTVGSWAGDDEEDETPGGDGGLLEGAPTEPQPTCALEEASFRQNDFFESGAYEFRFVDLRFFRYRPDSGEAWIRMRHVCTYPDGTTTTEYVWQTTVDPDPRMLAESAYEDIQEEYVRPPVPALSPTTTGVVNLGMWLAVDEPPLDPISVTASAGRVSATTTAALTHTTFDMGDGSPIITCDRVGDPIPPDLIDTVEASPVCGHTYSSTNAGEPFEITITSHWAVSWTSNIGAGGDLGTMERTSTVPYPVLEIQTVGGPAGGD